MFSDYDLILVPAYLLLIVSFSLLFSYVKYYHKNPKLMKHFMMGLLFKFIGCFAFIFIYTFYYGSVNADTFRYYRNAVTISDAAIQKPELFAKIITKDRLTPNTLDAKERLSLETLETKKFAQLTLVEGPSLYTVIRLASIISLFSFQSYLVISIFFAFFSYLGIWGLYRVATKIFVNAEGLMAIPILYFPSVYFWGSSIMKDSIVIGFLGVLTYACYHIFIRKQYVMFNGILLFISVYFLLRIKEYVIISFTPALLIWLFLSSTKNFKGLAKLFVRPVSIAIMILAIALFIPLAGKISDKFAIDAVIKNAERTSAYLYKISSESGGSAYSLGEIDYSPIGLVKIFPKAVVVSLFRPFLFEVSNPAMLLSSIEGMLTMLLTVFVLIKVGFIRFVKYCIQEPFLLASLIFSVIFAFAVGISAFNFGALVRFKIPCLPFYGIALLGAYHLYLLDKRKKKEQLQG